jgi:aminoglycoside 6-adenylyltransferase
VDRLLAATAYERLLDKLLRWAETQPDILAVMVVGSHARVHHPADEWSDLDLILVAADPVQYLSDTHWLLNIGSYWCTFVERTSTGEPIGRRVLFEGGLDVDFVMLAAEGIQQRLREAPAIDIIRRGVRTLLDKSSILSQSIPPAPQTSHRHPPTQEDFQDMVQDFWYHAVWAAKKLRRGELWTAIGCTDIYMKRLLLRLMEWDACTAHGWDYDTWHGGRFLELWAEPRVPGALRHAFAHYAEEDIGRALLVTMDVFRWLAVETAQRLSYPYPITADEHVTEWVESCLSEKAQIDSHCDE